MKIEREPEREPENSKADGNITASLDDIQPSGKLIPPAKKKSSKKEQDRDGINMSHDVSVNVSETNESILEMKK